MVLCRIKENLLKICLPQWLFIILIACLGLGNMLTACGKKGPLILPEKKTTVIYQEQSPKQLQDEKKKGIEQ